MEVHSRLTIFDSSQEPQSNSSFLKPFRVGRRWFIVPQHPEPACTSLDGGEKGSDMYLAIHDGSRNHLSVRQHSDHSVDMCHKCAMDLQVSLVPLAVIHVAARREKRASASVRKRRCDGMRSEVNSDLTPSYR